MSLEETLTEGSYDSSYSAAFDALIDVAPGGLCEWPVDYSSCGDCFDFSRLAEGDQAKFERMAGEYLWEWTNRVFGLCTVRVRPCVERSPGGLAFTDRFWGRGPFPWQGSVSSGSWVPFLIGGKWYNMTCGCVSSCNCTVSGPKVLTLPGPVQSVLEVKIDGEVFPSSSYRLAYHRQLIRTDGENWPASQDMLAPSTEVGTFEVTYSKGVPVPISGQLASEFAKAYCADRGCQLPKRIQQIVRQEVTVTLMDDFANLKEGGTGIWLIDQWVQTMRQPRPYSSVRSVDVQSSAGRRGY